MNCNTVLSSDEGCMCLFLNTLGKDCRHLVKTISFIDNFIFLCCETHFRVFLETALACCLIEGCREGIRDTIILLSQCYVVQSHK
jgi:hypothetical protein